MKFFSRRRRRRQKQLHTKAERFYGTLFAKDFYLSQRVDVAEAGVDPLQHYLKWGWREGAAPHPLFDASWYLSQRTDVAEADVEPLTHYLEFGRHEGTCPNPLFDPAWYLSQRPDVAGEGVEPFQHYLEFGWREDASPHPLFDPAWYRAQRPGGVEAGIDPLQDYRDSGWREGASPHPLFDPAWYRSQLDRALTEPDIADYVRRGGREGLSPSPLVDVDWYRDTHLAGNRAIPVLDHYLKTGWTLGQSPNPIFDVASYRTQVRGLAEADLVDYVRSGEASGRRPCPLFSPAYYRQAYSFSGLALTHFLLVGDEVGFNASPNFRGRRYQSRYLSFSADRRALRHYMLEGRHRGVSLPDRTGNRGFDAAAELHARRSDTTSIVRPDGVNALIVLTGSWRPRLRELQSKQAVESLSVKSRLAGQIEVESCAGLVAWLHERRGFDDSTPVVLLDADTMMAPSDIGRLCYALDKDGDLQLTHPMVLDERLDVYHAGYDLNGGLFLPRGNGEDPMHPALLCDLSDLATVGPVLATRLSALRAAISAHEPPTTFAQLAVALSRSALKTPRATRFIASAVAFALGRSAPVAEKSGGGLPTRLGRVKPAMLFIDAEVPQEGRDAGSHYALQIMDTFQDLGFTVTLVPDAEMSAPDARILPVAAKGIVIIRAPFAVSAEQFLEGTTQDFSVIVMSRVYSGGRHAERLRARWPDAKLVFHPGDLHHLREMREAIFRESPDEFRHALALKAREIELSQMADHTIVVSEHERDILLREGSDRVRLVEPEFTNREPQPYDPKTRRGVAFIGGYRHLPNVDAVDYLCQTIWPVVTARRPDIPLIIIGSHPPPSFERYAAENVIVRGFVEDLDSELDTLRLTIAPLRYGAGVKMKIVSSLAAGVPVIGSDIALEGLKLAEGDGVLKCDDVTAFADTVIALYDNVERLTLLSRRGYDAVLERFSRIAVRRRYAMELGLLIPGTTRTAVADPDPPSEA